MPFAKLAGCNLLWIKVQVLVTKPDWAAKTWNPDIEWRFHLSYNLRQQSW